MLTISLFMILLAFFILLNSVAVIDQEKQLKALGSLSGSFGVLPGGLSVFKEEGKDIEPLTPPLRERALDKDGPWHERERTTKQPEQILTHGW